MGSPLHPLFFPYHFVVSWGTIHKYSFLYTHKTHGGRTATLQIKTHTLQEAEGAGEAFQPPCSATWSPSFHSPSFLGSSSGQSVSQQKGSRSPQSLQRLISSPPPKPFNFSFSLLVHFSALNVSFLQTPNKQQTHMQLCHGMLESPRKMNLVKSSPDPLLSFDR